jgi:hypothetical protein
VQSVDFAGGVRVDESDEFFSELERMAESCARDGASAIDALEALA